MYLYIKSGVLKNSFILCEHGTKSEAQRWQIIDMRSTGISFKAIGRQMGYHYTVVSRLVRKHTQINTVKDLPRSRRPHVMSQRAKITSIGSRIASEMAAATTTGHPTTG